MVDRRIDLNVSVPDYKSGELASGLGGSDARPRGEADPGARERFEQALQGGTPAAAAAPGSEAPAPFALFGLRPGATTAAGTGPAAAPAAWSGQIGDAVQSLMVGDGSSGNKQVRMELKDDVLPGVTVTVQELEGRCQVDFICAVEESRLRLNAAAPSQAQLLADRLARPVLLRVQTDDDADPCLFEVAASP
ncbi:MAG TPA: hypothetical protein VLJ58_17990 [Ramlibacter sp.]|nr:hypothetical protein [Ramlibacter sp.]